MEKKSGDKDGSDEPQFEITADKIAYLRRKYAPTEKGISEKGRIIGE